MPSRLHEALVALIVGQNPAIRTHGFAVQLRAAVPDGASFIPRLRPDAFLIDPDDSRVTAWEVEVEEPLTGPRLEDYARLAVELEDVAYWDLVLFTLDRHAIFQKVNLGRLRCAFLLVDHPKAAAMLHEAGGVAAVTAPVLERYVTAGELAELMGVSPSTVKRMVAAGMPSETWGMSRTRRYLPSQAMAWAHSRGTHRKIDTDNHRARRLTTDGPHQEE